MRSRLSKVLAVVFVYITFQVLMLSCCGDSYDCQDYICHITRLATRHFDNSGEKPIEVKNDTVTANAYILQINLTGNKEYAAIKNFHFFKSSYACGDGECFDNIELGSKLEAISISSTNNFNDTLSAGSELNSMFKIESISKINAKILDQLEYSDSADIDFLMIEKPTIDLSHKFIIDITFENGPHVIDTTSIINFTL